MVENENEIGIVQDQSKVPTSAGQSLDSLRDINDITSNPSIPGTNISSTRNRRSMKPGGGSTFKTDEDVNRFKNE